MSLQSRLSTLITAIGADVKDLKGTNWVVPSFVNNWGQYHVNYSPPYYKKANGLVYLAGMVGNSLNSGDIPVAQLAFTLPVGFRPSHYTFLPALSNYAFAMVRVYPNGEVYLGQPGSGSWFVLDGLVFKQSQ